MPLPVVPALPVIGGTILRYGSVVLATWAVSRSVKKGRRDQAEEDAHDRVEEGVFLRREPGQANVAAGVRRVLRLRGLGRGLQIDATAFGRIRFRKTEEPTGPR